MRFSPTLVIVCLLWSAGLGAQLLDYAQGELIVQFRPGVVGKSRYSKDKLTQWKRLRVGADMWLLTFDWSRQSETDLLDRYRRDPEVLHVQLNHRLASRRRPNDPRYPQQWQFWNTGQAGGVPGADYRAERAWDITTGGVTPNGDTIVIASIDNGIDLAHEDLRANIWINHREIPDNGIDDDGNGYVDDRYGWNTALDNPDVQAGKGDHGTPVMGQMAAVGHNGLGVTGMNWNTKVMHITNDFDPLESEVLQAYGYALEARQLYDRTGGRRGAYVVATNASWGRDRAFPSQSPIWCAVYDTLGKYGILSVAAVPNLDVDVDEVGDLPSLCESEYLITVTNLNILNEKVQNAARGALSVDLAAFGEGVVTTLPDDRYGAVFGTSYAAPAVTGAIGLMYSVPCGTFGELSVSDPPEAARRLRDALLQSVASLSTLTDVTRTGGALDVGAAVQGLQEACTSCLSPTSFAARTVGTSSTDLVLSWKRIASAGRVDLRYRPRDAANWDTLGDLTSPYLLSDLSPCTPYELQFLTYCNDAPFVSEIIELESPGCCRTPADFTVDPLPGGRLRARWEPVLSARDYTVRYRTATEEWAEVTTTETDVEIIALRNCRSYEVEIRTNCRNENSDFRARRQVKTLGCGVCLDREYCAPTGFGNDQEWIATVNIPGVLTNTSGRNEGAYRNFGDLTSGSIVPGGVYQVELTPDYRGNGFTQDFHVYVDWNQDAAFAPDELVVQEVAPRGGTARGSFLVPASAGVGLTRMRVIMQFNSVRTNGCPSGNQQYSGEVEDYCLDLTPVEGCPPPRELTATYDGPANVTVLQWGASAAPGGSYRVRYRERSATAYTERQVDDLSLRVEGINLCSSYEVQVASVCDGKVGNYRTVYLGDDCTFTGEPTPPDDDWTMAPNPATDRISVSWSENRTVSRIEVYAADGRRVRQYGAGEGETRLELPVDDLPPGIYLVTLVDAAARRSSRRLLVQ